MGNKVREGAKFLLKWDMMWKGLDTCTDSKVKKLKAGNFKFSVRKLSRNIMN